VEKAWRSLPNTHETSARLFTRKPHRFGTDTHLLKRVLAEIAAGRLLGLQALSNGDWRLRPDIRHSLHSRSNSASGLPSCLDRPSKAHQEFAQFGHFIGI
jgi:hypothetical protein